MSKPKKTEVDKALDMYNEISDRVIAVRQTLESFRELQSNIVFVGRSWIDTSPWFFDWPILDKSAYLLFYKAKSGMGQYWPYLKIKSKEKIFPIRKKVPILDSQGNPTFDSKGKQRFERDFEGNFIYEESLGHSKHIGKPGEDRHIEAVQQLINSAQWRIYQEQIENLEDLLDWLSSELRVAFMKLVDLGVVRMDTAVLGGQKRLLVNHFDGPITWNLESDEVD